VPTVKVARSVYLWLYAKGIVPAQPLEKSTGRGRHVVAIEATPEVQAALATAPVKPHYQRAAALVDLALNPVEVESVA